MKTLKFLTYSVFVLFLSISISSCSGDDGATGPAGADGIDGANGVDGNANVQTYVFEDPSWGSISYGDNAMVLTLDALTSDVLLNDLVLGFWQNDEGFWYSTDEHYYNGFMRSFISSTENQFIIKAFKPDGTINTTLPVVIKAKIIVIESTNTTTTSGNGARPVASKQQILNELKDAGVNTNDYLAVCEYYGIDPK